MKSVNLGPEDKTYEAVVRSKKKKEHEPLNMEESLGKVFSTGWRP